MSGPLSGRTALVTGGGKRIGRAICDALAAQGWSIAVHYHESEEEAEAACTELRAAGAPKAAGAAPFNARDLDMLCAAILRAPGGVGVA